MTPGSPFAIDAPVLPESTPETRGLRTDELRLAEFAGREHEGVERADRVAPAADTRDDRVDVRNPALA